MGPKALPSQMISVAIRPEVRVVAGQMTESHFALLRRWIELNRDVVIQFWAGEIPFTEAIAAIRPI